MDKYAIIMAGGNGQRLWPLSREDRPKQFTKLFGEDALLTSTIKRLLAVYSSKNIFVVGTQAHHKLLLECSQALIPSENILLEPLGRNTAACIAFATEHLKHSADDILAFFPADHYIADVREFSRVVGLGISAAEETDNIVLIGIKPGFSSTAYGYIRMGEPVNSPDEAHGVLGFVEKPEAQHAANFFNSGEYLWNCGIFISKHSVMRQSFQSLLPELLKNVQNSYQAMRAGDCALARKYYSEIENIPVDKGILEKSEKLLVLPGKFSWSDVGSFKSIHDILKDDSGNAVIEGSLFAPQANNLTVRSSKKVVVAPGVDNLVIIDSDDVLYICPANDSASAMQLLMAPEDFFTN